MKLRKKGRQIKRKGKNAPSSLPENPGKNETTKKGKTMHRGGQTWVGPQLSSPMRMADYLPQLAEKREFVNYLLHNVTNKKSTSFYSLSCPVVDAIKDRPRL